MDTFCTSEALTGVLVQHQQGCEERAHVDWLI